MTEQSKETKTVAQEMREIALLKLGNQVEDTAEQAIKLIINKIRQSAEDGKLTCREVMPFNNLSKYVRDQVKALITERIEKLGFMIRFIKESKESKYPYSYEYNTLAVCSW